ncbi:putative UDP-glucosyl transferase 73B6 [Carex rostrata]
MSTPEEKMSNSKDSVIVAATNNTTTDDKLRVFFIPFMERGHLIPLTDLACLLATCHQDVEATVVVTPGNVSFIRSALDRAASAGNTVQLITYTFPSEGLCSGAEPGSDPCSSHIDKAFHLTQPVHEELLHRHKPDAVVADTNFWWVTAIAADLGIPRLAYLITSTFSCLAIKGLCGMGPDIYLHDPVTVPGLPGPEIKIPLSELPDFVLPKEHYLGQQMHSMFKAESEGFGCIINSMYEFEKEYCEHYTKTAANRSYFVGPISCSYNRDLQNSVSHGGQGDVACLSWLDTKENGSVVFVCFGSQNSFKAAQVRELALGLESSRKNFLWVLRADPGEEWMPDGWEERVADRGFLVRGWAPQLIILRHAAVGAFVTHCGWNSSLEGITFGVPMLTWPVEFEQFITERLIVDIKGCGARVWEGGKRSTREEERELVPHEVIAEAVSRFMEPGGIIERARANARELAAMAKAAMAEGGSSRRDLNRLISDLFEAKRNKACR